MKLYVLRSLILPKIIGWVCAKWEGHSVKSMASWHLGLEDSKPPP